MTCNEVVAPGVKQDREAPRISKGNEVRLAGEEVDRQGLETGDALFGARAIVNQVADSGLKNTDPDQERLLVSASLDIVDEDLGDVLLGG